MNPQDRLVLDADGRPVSPSRDRETWKPLRAPRIGSSDTAAILGKNEYRGAWDVWDRIVLGDWDDADGADVRRGNRQESNAIARFTEVYGLAVEPMGMVHHPDDERLVSDLDGVIPRPEAWPDVIADSPLWDAVRDGTRGPGALEAKVPRVGRFYRYRDEGATTENVVQMVHHLMVTGLEWGAFAIYTPEYDDVLAIPVTQDVDWSAWLFEALRDWHRDHVVAGVRPSRPAPAPPRWPDPVPGLATLRTDEEWAMWAELTTLRHYELLEATEAYRQTEERLLELLGDAEQHVAGGGVTVKRRSTRSQRRKDYKALRAAIKAAQSDGDAEALLSIDPDDDAFCYQTTPSEKVDVTVTAPNPMEIMA